VANLAQGGPKGAALGDGWLGLNDMVAGQSPKIGARPGGKQSVVRMVG
jgi:hypothetical protein